MNKPKAVLISILVLTLLILLYLFGPFLIWGFFDSSWYQSEEVDIGPIDYNSILTNAEKAGYEIEGSWPWPGNFSGFEQDVPEVRENVGSAALVWNVRLGYEDSELMVFSCEGVSGTGNKSGAGTGSRACVALSNLRHSDPESPLQLSEFPEDAWLLEKLGLLLELDEKASENYLEALKKAAQNQTWDAEIEVSEAPDFPAVYNYLKENSDESEIDSFVGDISYTQGSYEREVFLMNGKRVGSVDYFVPRAMVTTLDNENRYKVVLRGSGKVWLEIRMPVGSSGDEIPEEEYREVFREIFETLGLFPEAVDRFEFSHSSSLVW